MIFASVGTHEQQFDRLVRAVDELDTNEKKIIQYGYSHYRPVSATGYQFLEFEQVRDYMLQASVVITHGGTGSVMLALSLGKYPVVAPRFKRHGEHVDDHQLDLVRALVEKNLIIPFYDDQCLSEKVEEARGRARKGREIQPDPRLVHELRKIIEELEK